MLSEKSQKIELEEFLDTWCGTMIDTLLFCYHFIMDVSFADTSIFYVILANMIWIVRRYRQIVSLQRPRCRFRTPCFKLRKCLL